MKITKLQMKHLSYLLSIPLLTVVYHLLNKRQETVYVLSTSFDQTVPFIKSFILPYFGFYPFVFLAMLYFCLKDTNTYFKTLVALNLSYILSFIIFFSFQTVVPRPSIGGSDFLSQLIAMIFKMDNPYNAFPSLHVVTSYLMIKGVQRCPESSKPARLLIYIFATLIIISTQFVKQHVVFDLVAGLLLAELSFEMIDYLFENRSLYRIKEWPHMTLQNFVVMRHKFF